VLSRREFIRLGAMVGGGMVLPLGMADKVFGFTLGGNPQPLPANPLLLTKYLDPLPVAELLTAGLPGGQADAEGDAEADGAGGLAGQLRSGILDIIKPDKLEALVNDASLDLASSALFADLVNARVRYWQERLGSSRQLGPPSAWLDWKLADDQLYLEIDYTVRTLLGSSERRCTALVPIWRPQDGKRNWLPNRIPSGNWTTSRAAKSCATNMAATCRQAIR